MKAIKKISPVPMEYQKIESGAKGYFSPAEQKIVFYEAGISYHLVFFRTYREQQHTLQNDCEYALCQRA